MRPGTWEPSRVHWGYCSNRHPRDPEGRSRGENPSGKRDQGECGGVRAEAGGVAAMEKGVAERQALLAPVEGRQRSRQEPVPQDRRTRRGRTRGPYYPPSCLPTLRRGPPQASRVAGASLTRLELGLAPPSPPPPQPPGPRSAGREATGAGAPWPPRRPSRTVAPARRAGALRGRPADLGTQEEAGASASAGTRPDWETADSKGPTFWELLPLRGSTHPRAPQGRDSSSGSQFGWV